jgi:S1-C subfamily serine protease
VYLTYVAAGSSAAQAGLVVGDRVYSVNGQSFMDSDDFRDVVFGLLDASATEFTLEVESRGHVHDVVVRLEPEQLAKKADI